MAKKVTCASKPLKRLSGLFNCLNQKSQEMHQLAFERESFVVKMPGDAEYNLAWPPAFALE